MSRLIHRTTVISGMAAGLLAMALAAPANAQEACSPGTYGDFIELTVNEGNDKAVTSAELEFQCGDTLSDGTFVPTGYRLHLEGECGSGACNYPTAILFPTARRNQLAGLFVFDGKDYTVRMRKTRRGSQLNLSIRGQERGKPQRARYRLAEK
ncbi:MAG: hypothetical protein AAGB11_08745 [Pseudomonadota bacterium]